MKRDYDIVIIGGGFFGCCLALYLRSLTDRIVVIEQEPELLSQASRVNQARVHTGFHYPRSFVTALRSARLQAQFARDFNDAVVDDFQMLYAIARRRSKVTAARFHTMFRGMRAPIAPAKASDKALFNTDLIEDVFACDEFAFDWRALSSALERRLEAHGIDILYGRSAGQVSFEGDRCRVVLNNGDVIAGRTAFNVTYAKLNQVLLESGLAPLPLKHEWAEVALVRPPEELRGRAVTVMDGPFFSMMPYPSCDLYSLTHVRYTPHYSWIDGPEARGMPDTDTLPRVSRWRHMMMDSSRYMPCAVSLQYNESLFTVKTVMTNAEITDGRPILLHRHHRGPDFYSVMGGKIDNIYDLFDALPELSSAFIGADERYLTAPL